ncbi:unnamed protein product [Allacma fusca]|uniref:Amidase domain-containing protein n=1 Tax=Allacma fusca TaxID=39272 RepID=A0A8J2PVC8_9HEXA|nr:unnamed protein product [Allacma fusca]
MGLDATSGIIGYNSRVVTSVFKSMLGDNFHTKYDPKIPPIPWNPEIHESTRKLRIGYFSSIPFFPPVGDTIDVVEKAVEALKSLGHTLVPIEIPEGARLMRCAANFLLADQSLRLNKLWKGEQVAKCAELNKLGARCPTWVLKLASFLMHRKMLSFLYSPALGSILDAGAFKSSELWDNSGEQKKLNEEMLATWSKLQLDCCLCPVMPFPAIPVNLPGLLPVAAVYTMTWNVVNFPAGVVKFGTESGKNIDNYDNRGDQALKMSQQACKESIGSPIGVQVVGLPFKEELVLRVMEELDNYAIENKLFA